MPESLTTAPPALALVVDDSEWSASSLETVLAPHGFAVLRAYTGRQALELMRSTEPDLVIVAARLPDVSGFDIARAVRSETSLGSCTPVLVFSSGPLGRAERLEALAAGAWDVLTLPLDSEMLLHKVGNFMCARREAHRLSEASLLDEQTGFYNARGLARRARELGAEALRLHAPLACAALSVEATGLPEASDAYTAPLVGMVATRVGSFLRRTSRLSDAVGRLGQVEFGIVAPSTGPDGVVHLIQRLQHAIGAEEFELRGTRCDVVLRAGYSAVPNYSQSTVDAVELLLRAASALHQARSSPAAPVVEFDTTRATFLH